MIQELTNEKLNQVRRLLSTHGGGILAVTPDPDASPCTRLPQNM